MKPRTNASIRVESSPPLPVQIAVRTSADGHAEVADIEAPARRRVAREDAQRRVEAVGIRADEERRLEIERERRAVEVRPVRLGRRAGGAGGGGGVKDAPGGGVYQGRLESAGAGWPVSTSSDAPDCARATA